MHRQQLIGNLQLKQNILPATEFTYVAPCTPDNLINIWPHEKLSPKAGNLEQTELQPVM